LGKETWKNKETAAAIFLIVLLICSLLPVMILGRYNHATGDDYNYGAETHLIWEETGSLLQTAGAAFRGVAVEYMRWQGTYSAMLFMYLPPNLFSEDAYTLVTTVILLCLTGSVFYFLKPFICRRPGGSLQLWIISACTLVILCVETVPFQGESFFWYNGSMYYTGYFAVTLFFWGLLLRYLEKGKGWRLALLGVLSVFLAGGNYVTLLPCLILLATLTLWFFYKKHKRKNALAMLTLLMLCGLAVSAMAPGNQLRQDSMWKLPAWKAIAKSLLQGARYCTAWTRGWQILAALLLTPFLWSLLKKTSFRFPCPVPVIGYLYGVFCSMSCPLFYTMNSTGPARAVAVIYYGYILFSFGSYVYLLGFLCRRLKEKKELSPPGGKKAARIGWILAIIIIPAFQVMSGAADSCTTPIAVRLLASGEAEAYRQEYLERMEILKGEDTGDIVLQPYVHQPQMLYVGDFSGDPDDEANRKLAQYFHKASVRVEY